MLATRHLDLTALKPNFADADSFARWIKVHDRIESGEMPPKKKARPTADEVKTVTGELSAALIKADLARLEAESRTGVRRLTRAEYENRPPHSPTPIPVLTVPGATGAKANS